jgi:hypothetical protein
MEKTIELNPQEMQQISQMEQEDMRMSARAYKLRREMDKAEEAVAQLEQAQRSFVQTVLTNRGVGQIQQARLEGNVIRYVVPEEQTRMEAVEKERSRPNGTDAGFFPDEAASIAKWKKDHAADIAGIDNDPQFLK